MTERRFSATERMRLQALASYELLDTSGSAAIDALTRVAARVCGSRIALVSLVDEHRQWFLTAVGLSGVRETPRERSFCSYAIEGSEVMEVEDARNDPRFAEHPLVMGEPNIRFYAGAPLVDREGFALGTLCVIDSLPRQLTTDQLEALRDLASAVVDLIHAKRTAAELHDALEGAAQTAGDLALVLDSVPSRIAYTDPELRNRFANAAYAASFGRSPEALRGVPVADLVGEELHRDVLPHMQAALRGERQSFEREVRSLDGDCRDMAVVYLPDVRNGTVRGFVTSLTDVTELRRTVRLTERRNALLVLAEEVGETGHWRLDVEESQIYWSPQVYRIHGREPSMPPPSVTEAIESYHPDDRVAVQEALDLAIETGAPFDLDVRLLLGGGMTRRVHVRGRAERDRRTGLTRALFGVLQDVSEREALRDRIRRQERLVTTGTLAAGVGHEINNPLTYVSANIDFALDEIRAIAGGSPSGRMRDVLEVLSEARQGTERIRKIVRGLRAFAREDSVAVATDVAATIEFSVSMAMHELRQHATLEIENLAVNHVLADESRLSQIIVNLLVNAAHAFETSDATRNRVVVTAENVGDDRVAIEVRDNGAGIAGDVIGRIFDPFFTTKPVGKGTGLGLAICQSIASSLEGELSCTTEVGSGTTFRLILPAAPGEAMVPERPPEALASEPVATRGRILLVDDEESILRVEQRVLSGIYDVVALTDPREAVRRIIEDREMFDVVFCDLMMPQLSGMEVYRQVGDFDPALAARFIFVTGGGVAEDISSFLATVPNERIEKPFTNDRLRDVARSLVQRSARRPRPR